MTAASLARAVAAAAVCAALGACDSGDDTPAVATTAPTYSLGGTVSSAGGTIVLQDNGGDDLTLANVGTFTFATRLAAGAAFAVTVRTSPTSPLQTCVAHSASGGPASGTIASADVGDLAIVCSPVPVRLGGTVSGLAGSGLVIAAGAQTLPVGANGSFQFAQAIQSTASYAVTVATQPTSPAQTCAVTNGSGNQPSADVTSVQITCTTDAGLPCGTPNGTVVTHSTDISASETWAGDGTVHLIPATVAINAPATVTVQPCAIVELADGAGIDVRGATSGTSTAALVTAGTDMTTAAVYFRSSVATGGSHRWRSLRGLNVNSRIDLAYTFVADAGSTSTTPAIQMQGSSTLPDAVLRVNTVLMSNMGGSAIHLSDAAFTADSVFLAISDTPGYPIELSAMALGSVPSMTLQNAAHPEILVVDNANIFDNLTIRTTTPIRFNTSGVHVGGLAPTFVPNLTLTLEAGVTLRFAKWSTGPTMMSFGDIGQTADKNAALVVHGTSLQPVTLTSGEAVPAPGDWAGVWLQTSNGSQLDHLVIEYAGGDAAVGPRSCGPATARHTAAILIGDGTDAQYVPPGVTITNSEFRQNAGNFAIDSVWQSTAFGPDLTASNLFTSPGTVCRQSKNFIVGGCTVGGVDQTGCLVH